MERFRFCFYPDWQSRQSWLPVGLKDCGRYWIRCLVQRASARGRSYVLRVFLSSHGHMASGLADSLSIFMAVPERLTVYDAYIDGDDTTLAEKLDAFYADVKPGDQVLLLSDIYGGSVNTEMCSHLGRTDTRLVTGVNLPFLLEVMAEEDLPDKRLNEIIDDSRTFLKRVSLDDASDASGGIAAAANDEEEFF